MEGVIRLLLVENDETKTLTLIDTVINKQNVNQHTFFSSRLMMYAIRYNRVKCAKKLLDIGAIITSQDIMEALAVRNHECLSLFLCHDQSAELPLNVTVSVWIKTCKPLLVEENVNNQSDAAIALLKDIRKCANRARSVALTLICIRRFHPRVHPLSIIGMDVVRMIAKMCYSNGLYEWRSWKEDPTAKIRAKRYRAKKRMKKRKIARSFLIDCLVK